MELKMCRSTPLSFAFIFSLVLPVALGSQPFECVKEGRFFHPNNCSAYIDCIFHPTQGRFEARIGQCAKGGFDQTRQSCDLMNGCPYRSGRLIKIDARFNNICEEKSGFFCGDCNTLVNCIEGEAISESCPVDHTCQYKPSFSGAAVCHADTQPKCICEEINNFQPDPYNKRAFFFCDSYAIMTSYLCPEEMIYDKYAEQCVHPEGLQPCTQVGVFAIESDCRHYYACIQSHMGWVQKLFHCPHLMMYNERNYKCENPCRWARKDFICKSEGRFQDKTDCQAFFECIKGDVEKNEFKMIKRRCPSEFHWEVDSRSENKGFCVSTDASSCRPFTSTTCDVPPDWCEDKNEENSSHPLEDEIKLDQNITQNTTEPPFFINNSTEEDISSTDAYEKEQIFTLEEISPTILLTHLDYEDVDTTTITSQNDISNFSEDINRVLKNPK